jgi:tetratricopeptide (TPR) repeat protein
MLRRAVSARLFAEQAYRVGRFTIVRRLGAGGMGVVWLAYDADLEREVAVKLLRPELAIADPEAAARRVLREAQAMARLRHPNVVVVHEVGEHDGGIYVAMEYVRGTTLRGWLEQPRTHEEILAVFVAAGRGLAAAHAAGLVHRDFKPDNVLIGEGDRVCVTDFGLARLDDGGPTTEPQTHAVATDASGARTGQARAGVERLRTTSSGIAGTPAYMASECLSGRPATAASDQFSFCVALFEALWGVRPFGETLASLATAVTERREPLPPARPRVSAAIRAAVLRGLAHDPARRFATMDELLAELARDRARTRRRIAIAGAAAVAIAGLAWAKAAAPTPCADLDGGVRALWSDQRRGELGAAFVREGRPYAERTWTAAAAGIDAWVDEWAEHAVLACRATEIQRTQSAELLDRRMGCLDRRQRELGALLDALAEPDGFAIERAVQAVGRLPRPRSCSEVDVVGRRDPPPVDPEARAEHARLTDGIAAARAAHDTGRFAEARTLAEPLVAAAVELGHRPTEAEARLVLGDALDSIGETERSRDELELAIAAAEAGGADDVSARAWIDLGYVEAWSREDLDLARRAAAFAEAEIEALGDEPRLRAALLKLRGSILLDAGEHTAAESLLREALAEFERMVPPDEFGAAAVRLSIGNALDAEGRFDDAIVETRAAVEGFSRALGPEHPHTLSARSNLANLLSTVRRIDEAEAEHVEVLALRERSLGAEHPDLAASLTGLAGVHYYREHYERALEYQRRAAAIFERARGHDHTETIAARDNLAIMLRAAGHAAESLAAAQEVLASRRRVQGAEHPEIVTAIDSVAHALHDLGRDEEAAAHYESALALAAKVLRPDHSALLGVLRGAGEVALARGRPVEARKLLERALAIGEAAYGPDHVKLEGVLRALATALDRTGDADAAADMRARAERY